MQKKGIMMGLTIKIDNLVKNFKNNEVIKGASYEFVSGNVYGIVGGNGAGKSVLLKMILGMMKPDSGKVSFGGITENKAAAENENIVENKAAANKVVSVKPDMACVIDGCDLIMNMSGLENLIYLAGFRKLVDEKCIRECMKKVGLNPDNKDKIKNYSLGMRKRLLIVQAIMENPDVLILDEPTNSLDSSGVRMLHDIVHENKEAGRIIIIASHYEQDIDGLCDIVLSLKDGVLC